MSKSSSIYIGMDVRKESINIAMAGADGWGEVRHYGTIGGDLAALERVYAALRLRDRACGYTIYRHLAAQGYVATAP